MPETLPYRRLLLTLCAIWMVLNFNVLFTGRVLPWDAIDQFYPTVYFNAHALRMGQWPWWNPYVYGGYAQIGDPQGMLFSPLLMAWMLLREEPGAVWFCWGVLLHVLMGGAAMLDLLRRQGANALGCLLGATVFMAGGVAASRLEHTPDVIAYAYAPVVLLALRHLLDRPTVGRGCLLGLAAGAMVTQLVQPTYLLVLVIVAYAVLLVGHHYRTRPEARRRLCLALVSALLVALAIGLPQLVFSWATMSLSNRRDVPLALAAPGSVEPRAFALFFHPNAFDGLRNMAHAPVDMVSSFLYIGVVPLLSLAALPRAWAIPRHRRTLAFFGGVAMVAVVYMLGTHTPVYGWLYGWMPGLDHFRRPADAAYVLNFALAFLVGIAASQVNLRSRRETTVLLVIAMAWLTTIAASMHYITAFICVATAAIALWYVRKSRSDWRVALCLVTVLVADYRSFNLNGTFNESGNGAARFARNPAVRYLSEQLASGTATGPRERITTTNTHTNWDNTGIVVGIASTQGYNPLRYALYERWYGPRESANAPAPLAPYRGAAASRVDDLLGVRYMVLGHRTDLAPYAPPAWFRMVRAGDDVDLWRNERTYPRFLNPVAARTLGVDEWPDADAFEATDFASTVWLTPRDSDDFLAGQSASGTCTGKVDIGMAPASHTRIDLTTRSVTGGWVVAGELDYPGWEAELDGRPLHVHRANGMFRAVCVPAGNHGLSFVFRPWTLVGYAWKHRS